jgi:hypothetical protein
MLIALSPYHLTSREPAALTSLLLAQRAITLVPPPLDLTLSQGDAIDPLAAGRRVPAFAEFIRSWQWSERLWKQGVLCAKHLHHSATDDVLAVCDHLRTDNALLPLRHFVKGEDSFGTREAYLHAVASDVLKGGPDPGISLPVCAGLDRFASRFGLVVARSRPQSLAQQAEARMGRTLFTIAVPGFLQASAPRLLHAREVLAQELRELGEAIAPVARRASDPRNATPDAHESLVGSDDMSELHNASGSLSQAWEDRREELLMGAKDDDVRVIEGTITIMATLLPWDVALTSSVRALAALAPKATKRSGQLDHLDHLDHHNHFADAAQATPAAAQTTTLIPRNPMAGKHVLTLLVKPMGQPKR